MLKINKNSTKQSMLHLKKGLRVLTMAGVYDERERGTPSNVVPATIRQPQQQPTKQKHKQTTSERHNTKGDENRK